MRLPRCRPRIGWPAPTIRLRLTVIYGLVFLVTGAVLLTIGYLLVRHNLDAPENFRAELRKLGIPAGAAFPGGPWGSPPALPRPASPMPCGPSSATMLCTSSSSNTCSRSG